VVPVRVRSYAAHVKPSLGIELDGAAAILADEVGHANLLALQEEHPAARLERIGEERHRAGGGLLGCAVEHIEAERGRVGAGLDGDGVEGGLGVEGQGHVHLGRRLARRAVQRSMRTASHSAYTQQQAHSTLQTARHTAHTSRIGPSLIFCVEGGMISVADSGSDR
jgi:hypothetical protein